MSKNSLYSQSAMEHVQKHLEQYTKLISFWRFYPDLLLDYINTKGIKFNMSQRIYLRMLVRSKGLYSVVFRGYGKCVTGDTLIITDKGIKEIGSLFNYQNDGKETIYNFPQLKVINRNGDISEAPMGIYSGKKPTVKILTRLGYELEGSYIHPILVNNGGEIDFKKLFEIDLNDEVIIKVQNYFQEKEIKTENEIEKIKEELLNSNSFPSYIWDLGKTNISNLIASIFNCNEKTEVYFKNEEVSKKFQMMCLYSGRVFERVNNKVSLIKLFVREDEPFYDKVSEIIEGEADVYDISVPDTNSFVSNGFVSHNTFYEVLAGILYCLLYPTGTYAISAQTKENAASVTAAKVNQLLNMFPTLQNEVVKKKISKTMVEVFFKNGSKLD